MAKKKPSVDHWGEEGTWPKKCGNPCLHSFNNVPGVVFSIAMHRVPKPRARIVKTSGTCFFAGLLRNVSNIKSNTSLNQRGGRDQARFFVW